MKNSEFKTYTINNLLPIENENTFSLLVKDDEKSELNKELSLSIGILSTTKDSLECFFNGFMNFIGYETEKLQMNKDDTNAIALKFFEVSQLKIMLFNTLYDKIKEKNLSSQVFKKFTRGYICNFCDLRIVLLEDDETKKKYYNWYSNDGYKSVADTDDGLIIIHMISNVKNISDIKNKLTNEHFEISKIVDLNEREEKNLNLIGDEKTMLEECKYEYTLPENSVNSDKGMIHLFYYKTNKSNENINEINYTVLNFICAKITTTLRKSPKRYTQESKKDFNFNNTFKGYYTFFLKQIYDNVNDNNTFKEDGDELFKLDTTGIKEKNAIMLCSSRYLIMNMFDKYNLEYSVEVNENDKKIIITLYSNPKSLKGCPGKFIEDYAKIEPKLLFEQRDKDTIYSTLPEGEKSFVIKIKNQDAVIGKFKVSKDNVKKENNIIKIIYPLA